MSGSLPLKYRPNEFEYVYGNDDAIGTVKSILSRDALAEIPKAWLFTGESGTGKTTMVRIMQEKLGCTDVNFHEYNSANARKIDNIREISALSRLSAMGGGIKIFLLDECHQITKDAQNALLKVLEDTPDNTYFFLATTNPEKLLKTIKTRCTTISMKPCNWKVLSDLCQDIAQEEGVDLSAKVAVAIGKAAGGSPREALKILDQVIDIEEEEKVLSAIEKTIWSEPEMFELCQTLLNKPIWKEVSTVLKPILEVADTEGIRRMVLGYFNSVLLGKDSIRAVLILEQFLKISKYDVSKAEITFACYSAVYEIQKVQDTGEDVPF